MDIKSKFNIGDVVYYGSYGTMKKFKIKSISFTSKRGVRYSETEHEILANEQEIYLFKTLEEAKNNALKEIDEVSKYMKDKVNKIKKSNLKINKPIHFG